MGQNRILLVVIFMSLFMNISKSDAAKWPVGSTGHLVQACNQRDGTMAGYCRGMVIGVSAILSANSGLNPRPPFHACVGNTDTRTIIRRFIQWAERNSTHLNEGAPIGLTSYLMERFPC